MKLSKIFVAWMLSVIIGSLGFLVFGGGIMLFALVFSTICSLPTLIALIIVSQRFESAEPLRQINLINKTHIIMFLLTLIVGYILSGTIQYVAIVCFYAFIASIIWFAMFRSEYKSAKITNSDRGAIS